MIHHIQMCKIKEVVLLFFTQPGDVTQSCSITLEPVSRRQRCLPEPVEVCVKGVLQGWDTSSLSEASTESWVLHCSNSRDMGVAAFQHLLMELSAHAVHMVRHPTKTVLGAVSVCSLTINTLSLTQTIVSSRKLLRGISKL